VVLQDHRFQPGSADALDGLDRWPEKVRLMQKNWIGRSEGLLTIRWESSRHGTAGRRVGLHDPARHAVRRLLPGDRADHPLAKAAAEKNPAIEAFSRNAAAPALAGRHSKGREEGFDTGIRVRHPLDPSWELPVYVANFVLMEYGTGAIFGCPSGDQRDLDFARKYGLPSSRPSSCPRTATRKLHHRRHRL
jgi:leucyl-tRNA synthetase